MSNRQVNHSSSSGRWRIDNAELVSISMGSGCIRQILPAEAGVGYTNILPIDPCLSIIETHYSANKNLSIVSQLEAQQPTLVLTLGLEGSSRYLSEQGDEIVFTKGYSTITSFTSSVGERQYVAQDSVSQLRLSVGQSWLEMYFEKEIIARIFAGPALKQLSHHPITLNARMAVQQICAAQVPDAMRSAFLKGQALSILACEMANLLQNEKTRSCRVNERDQKIFNQSREILIEEYRNPPNVEELAKRVGTNEFKLKQLFHRYLNKTIYGLVFETRMTNAYRLLETRRYSVATVAEMVGYCHASNFSAAFTKYFGISPKSLSTKS